MTDTVRLDITPGEIAQRGKLDHVLSMAKDTIMEAQAISLARTMHFHLCRQQAAADERGEPAALLGDTEPFDSLPPPEKKLWIQAARSAIVDVFGAGVL